jgi:hypothetical protein
MIATKSFGRTASSLILLLTLLGITSTYATTEGNYRTDNNFLTNISEGIHIESVYRANIILNPNVMGIDAKENGYRIDLIINHMGIGGLLKENNYKLDLIPEKTLPEDTYASIPGDLNGDSKVSLADLVILALAYGSKPGDSNWNPNADIDGNLVVGLSDLVILAQNYGRTDTQTLLQFPPFFGIVNNLVSRAL